MKIRQKHIGIIVVVFLWLLMVMDDVTENTWYIIMAVATVRIAALSAAYNIHKYLYPKFEKSSSTKFLLIAGFLLVAIVLSIMELLFDEPDFRIKDDMVNEAHNPNHPIGLWVHVLKENHLIFEVFFTLIFSSIQVAIAMTFSWVYQLFEKNRQNQLAISRLETLNKEAELSELKNQINPHFLFNALSNIYSIAYLGDKETPSKIMQLSKMLRYVIYDTNVKQISLASEIDYINLFIEFQRFKIEKEQQIEFNYNLCDQSVEIAPLLLLPFIENAFKHSQLSVEDGAWVKIELETNTKNILFSVKNTISDNRQPEILNNDGIGMENIKKRLQLIYNKKHNLNIEINLEDNQKVFGIELKIEL